MKQLARCVLWNFNSKSERDLLPGRLQEAKTQELKSTLSVISKHITSLIRAAENRARDGNSPSPTARGGLGVTLKPIAAAPTAATQKAGARNTAPQTSAAQQEVAPTAAVAKEEIPETPEVFTPPLAAAVPKTKFDPGDAEALKPFPERRAAPTAVVSPTLASAKASAFPVGVSASVLPADVESAPVGVPARTRVLRRVSSIRKLFLGATKTGEQLEHFAEQMGLPHDVVVKHFQV